LRVKPAEKKVVEEPERTPRAGALDEELTAALLAVCREIELEGQMRALLATCGEWAGATFAVGFGAGEERNLLTPLVATAETDAPRVEAFSPLSPDQLAIWFTDATPRVFDGLGPFASVAQWPAAPPACCWALPLVATHGEWGGLLLLLLGRRPAAALQQRVCRLTEVGRFAIDNALRVLALRELVIKDDTAHCFNRRHFEEFLPEELARANRFRSPVSLIFLDMDNLKQVNSRHGHAAGSQTLREVSLRVRSKIRKFDKLFRFGGDEFCIVLPETAWHGALEVAERVRDAISGAPFLERRLEDGLRMSASLGIASYPLHARTQAELIERADRAMQKVKRSGKSAIGISGIEGDDEDAR
jgi:diguanylate cyclase (GGDEF)-like protein